MKRKLYKWIIPGNIKDKLYKMHVQQYLQGELQKRSEYELARPHCDLSPLHIRNLRVLVNKSELLRMVPRNVVAAVIGNQPWKFLSQLLVVTQPVKLHLFMSGSDPSIELLERQLWREIQMGQVEFLIGEPAIEMERLKSNSVDWIYVDKIHSYSAIFDLLEISQAKLVYTGLICGGSYVLGDWILSQRFEVIEAVNDFCRKNRWELVYLTNESDRNLSYAIKKIRTQENSERLTPELG